MKDFFFSKAGHKKKKLAQFLNKIKLSLLWIKSRQLCKYNHCEKGYVLPVIVIDFIMLKTDEGKSGMFLKGKFSSGIEGAIASTFNHDFNWKQLSEIILCIFLLMFSKFI